MSIDSNPWIRGILKVGIIVVPLSTLCYKFATASIKIEFDFSDFLSLILALFSIWLSAEFYFKAAETSNSFYDRVLDFTKESSVIMGRIESGLGERINNVVTRLDRMSPQVIEEKKEELELTNVEIEKIKQEKDLIIKDLMGRLQMETEEKEELISKLTNLEEQLVSSTIKQSIIQNQLSNEEFRLSRKDRMLLGAIAHKIGLTVILTGETQELCERFKEVVRNLSNDELANLERIGIMNHHTDLTAIGLDLLKQYVNRNQFINYYHGKV